MSEEKQYKYTLSHAIKKPTAQYANEDFFYSVRGDDMKEVIADLKKLRAGYPAITHKEKVEALQNSTNKSTSTTKKGTLDF